MLTPGDILKRVLLFFVGGSLVVAVARGFPIANPNEWYNWGKEQANNTQEWVTGFMDDVPFEDLPEVDSIIPSAPASDSPESTPEDAAEPQKKKANKNERTQQR